MTNCGIFHIKTAPYHPQTNGEAERFVQTFKNLIKRVDHDKSMNQRQIDEAILKFLMNYRCTPHSGTEFTPSYLMLNRQIKNVFDLLRTKTSKIEHKSAEYQNKLGEKCLSIQKVNRYSFEIIILKINMKKALFKKIV